MARMSESTSSLESSKSAGNSLHRNTSLGYSSLPRRMKSFQGKLNFGDVNDDVHVGVQCLRAVMNNQVHITSRIISSRILPRTGSGVVRIDLLHC